MPGGNFDDVVTIEGPKVLTGGPLRKVEQSPIQQGAEREVYVWIVQQKAGEKGAFAQLKGIPVEGDADRWTTDNNQPRDVEGEFQAGPALGLAVEITKEK